MHIQFFFSLRVMPLWTKIWLKLYILLNQFCQRYSHDTAQQIFPTDYASFELRNWPKLNILINQYVSTIPLKISTEFRENVLLQRRYYCVNAQIHRKFWFDLFLREHGTLAILYNFVQFVWNRFSTYVNKTYFL